ncbi:hypothetical protein FW320_00035 [Azospirillum sp. Vi22]|uniref:hypothetical protein n=1 Tax=Azospirillum baldaniorum TaxID=1064539 RepID=UPI00157B30B5|nr:hypothetical protein [Azospirillum baldaniorum]NUB04585.1 hypothetical protein [Azospirillum baldaniorum]
MRHFTQVAEPIGGFLKSRRESIDIAHFRSESEFKQQFGRDPDHTDPSDVDECWRLFVEELEIMTSSFESVGDELRDQTEETEALVAHYRAAWEKARQDSGVPTSVEVSRASVMGRRS